MYQALYRKWRPRTFDDVVGQSHITDTLKTQVTSGRLSHAYLFTGTRGTGKTTCAKILARAVNCEHPVNGNPCNCCPSCLSIEDGTCMDVQELDAASNNGVDSVRLLQDEAIYTPAEVKKRVYIVDEVHMMSISAFNALLKIIEEPPPHLMFILATTELNKVPATILSRCQRFSFKRILPEDITSRLMYIAGQEQIDLTEDGASLLARLADGALRDALSLLDQCAISGRTVDRDQVMETLGLAGNLKTAHMLNAIRKNDTAAALQLLGDLYADGKDMKALLGELATLTRDLLIRQAAPNAPGLMAGGYDEATLKMLTKGLPAHRLVRILTILQETQDRLRTSTSPRTEIELGLIRICDESLDGSTDGLAARLSRLEDMAANGTFTVTAAPEDASLPPVEKAAPAKQEAPKAPQKKAPAPKAQPKKDVWPDISKELVRRTSGNKEFMLAVPGILKNREISHGVLDGSQFIIYVSDPGNQSFLNTPEFRELAGKVVQELLRTNVSVTVRVDSAHFNEETGKPMPAPSEEDWLSLVTTLEDAGIADIHS